MSAPLPADDAAIAAMEALAKAATPSPWRTWVWSDPPQRWPDDHGVVNAARSLEVCNTSGSDELQEANAAFIAAAREFVPAIIARVRAETERADRAEAEVAKLQAEIDRWKSKPEVERLAASMAETFRSKGMMR